MNRIHGIGPSISEIPLTGIPLIPIFSLATFWSLPSLRASEIMQDRKGPASTDLME